MKKITLFFGIILTSSLASCCRQNSHCVVVDNSGNTVKDYGVKNGSSSDVTNYENSCRSDASNYNGTLNCNHMH